MGATRMVVARSASARADGTEKTSKSRRSANRQSCMLTLSYKQRRCEFQRATHLVSAAHRWKRAGRTSLCASLLAFAHLSRLKESPIWQSRIGDIAVNGCCIFSATQFTGSEVL